MNRFSFLLLSVVLSFGSSATTYEANWESLNARPCPQWWRDAKLGIFIHWGLYSVPAFSPTEGKFVNLCYAEHYGNPDRWRGPGAFPEYHARHHAGKSYGDFAADFTAEHFEPKKWADLLKRSGARYVVLTSKHHEGFALWPSKYTPYFNAMEMGAKRDLCGELAEAVRAAGLHMGFYYSLLEWRHPLYAKETINRFVAEVNLPQMKELVTRYRPDVLWTDGEWDYPWETWRGPEFLSWLYNESPVGDTVVVNDRWGKGFRGKCGDYYTTEYDDGPSGEQSNHPWEECRGIGNSFGYNRFETVEHYLSDEGCVEALCEKVSRGGNLLLNIGPDATGLIPVVMQERLLALGAWLKQNGEAIYGTTAWKDRPSTMRKDRVYYTAKGNRVYAIVFGFRESIVVPKVGAVSDVRLLGSDKRPAWKGGQDGLTIEMPAFRQGEAPNALALVFEIVRNASS